MAVSPGPKSPSLRPALVVLAVAVVIVGGGSALALVGAPSHHPVASQAKSSKVPGAKLRAQPARAVLDRIAASGEPPADIVAALAVPAGSRYLGKRVNDRGLTQFDRTVKISVDAPVREVRTFYVRLLSQRHWVTSSITTPSGGGSEVIATKAGSDGYQWTVGIVMKGVSTVVSPALGGAGASPVRTTASIELYQVGDAS